MTPLLTELHVVNHCCYTLLQMAARSNTVTYHYTHCLGKIRTGTLKHISTKRKEKVPSFYADFTSTIAQSCQQGNESLNILPHVIYSITKVLRFLPCCTGNITNI
jgi:hypothetical protein